MADVPYYRTVPSSPEPDEDEVLLPGKEDILEDEEDMSPAVPDTKTEAEKEKTAQKMKEEDEEAVLRRKLLEKKREKEQLEQKTQEKRVKAKTGEKEQSQVGKEDKSKTSSAKPKREKIVWDKQREQGREKRAEEEKPREHGKERRREPVVEHRRTHQEKREKHSTTSHHKPKEYGHGSNRREETKNRSPRAPSSADRHQRMEKPKREEGKKRQRHSSSSEEEEEEVKRTTKTAKKEHKNLHEQMEKVSVTPEEVEEMDTKETEPTLLREVEEEKEEGNPKKKAYKFESTPEMSEEEEEHVVEDFLEEEEMDKDFPLDEEELGKENGEEENGIEDELIENKPFEELTLEEKALISPETLKQMEARYQKKLISQLPVYYPGIAGCRGVNEYECLNKISEGTFGVVYRAQEKRTDEIVALKRLKMEKEHQGFPITSLREINMLLKCGTHPNVINVREVVVGSSMDKIYLVMEYVEHDMKALMELMKSRNKKWTISQVKTLLHQLLSGIQHMHEEYVIHRDLKTSNLLLSHQGILKIGDFGLAREFGEPIKPYTPVVVTLWYRSPELLLGTKVYSTPVDMWSVGCIFGEFLKMEPIFPGRTEVDQMQKIFKDVGTPNEQIWPGCSQLPGMKHGVFAECPYNQLRRKYASELPDDDGFELLNKLLALNPSKRLSASEALKSKWFQNDPKPAPSSSFPTWPAKSEQNKKPPNEPMAPRKQDAKPKEWALRFDVPKF